LAGQSDCSGNVLIEWGDADAFREYCETLLYDGSDANTRCAVPYRPRWCVTFQPASRLAAELRQLATDLAPCLATLFRAYSAGFHLTAADSVSARIPASRRPQLPTLVRLDVIETADGCKVIEVNAGNCAGIELCAQVHGFLRLQVQPTPTVPVVLPGIAYWIDVVRRTRAGAVSVYLEDEQSRTCALVRRALMRAVDSTISVEVIQAHDVMDCWQRERADALFLREFMFDDLDPCRGDHVAVERLLLGLSADRQFPSPCDEFLADKSYIAAVDELVRSGSGSAAGLSVGEMGSWMRWMAPTRWIRPDPRHPSVAGFAAPDGLIVKPAHGYGGRGVVRVARLADARLDSGDRHVMQAFYRTTSHSFIRHHGDPEPMHVVHGVFLLPRAGALRYGGTFTRFAPGVIVDQTADVALFYEPDW
jgi:hypothetical protein